MAFASLKKYNRASEDFNKVLELSPQSTWARDLRGEAIRLLKAPEQSNQSSDPFANSFVPASPSSDPQALSPNYPSAVQSPFPGYGISVKGGDIILEGLAGTMIFASQSAYPTVTPPVVPPPSETIRHTTYRGHSASVYAVAWSPDVRYLASGSSDKTVQVWEATTGKLTRTYLGHSDTVRAVVWSPDGKHIASGSLDHKVMIWDAATEKHVLTYHGHSAPVHSVGWSSDGTRIASAGDDKTVQVWKAQ